MTENNKDIYEQIIENEHWLGSFTTPSPSPETVRKIKDAISSELSKEQTRSRTKVWRIASGIWAAAAVIVLSMTTVWYSSRLEKGPRNNEPELVVVSDVTIPVPPSINDSLAELEQWNTQDQTDLSGTSLYDALEDVLADSRDVQG